MLGRRRHPQRGQRQCRRPTVERRTSNVASYDNHFGGAQGESAVSHKYTTTTTDPDWSGYGGGGSNQPGGASSHGDNGGTVGTNNAAPSLSAAAALNQGRAAKSA